MTDALRLFFNQKAKVIEMTAEFGAGADGSVAYRRLGVAPASGTS